MTLVAMSGPTGDAASASPRALTTPHQAKKARGVGAGVKPRFGKGIGRAVPPPAAPRLKTWPKLPVDKWTFPDGTVVTFLDVPYGGTDGTKKLMTSVFVNGEELGTTAIEFDGATGELVLPFTMMAEGGPMRVPAGALGNDRPMIFMSAVLVRQLLKQKIAPGQIRAVRNQRVVNPTSVLALAIATRRGGAPVASDLHIVRTTRHLLASMGLPTGESTLEGLTPSAAPKSLDSFAETHQRYFRGADQQLFEDAKRAGVEDVPFAFDVVTKVP